MTDNAVPTALLSAVRRDLRPVRPLASPARRTLALLPLALALLIGVPMVWRWRAPVTLAPWPSWPLSTIETTLSLMVLAAAFREAIPGRELSTRTLGALACIACVAFLVINPTVLAPPIPASTEALVQWTQECITRSMTFSLPGLIVPAWLVSRALPNRPALTGALCGLGVGLMADAGLRLYCWNSSYAHVAIAHGGSIAILVALGAVSATVVERIKARSSRVLLGT